MMGMEARSQASARYRTPVGQLAVPAIFVALAAATLAGSCTGFADESGGGIGVLTAALVAGGVALAVSLAFVLLTRSWRGAKLLTVISVAAYLSAGFGAWWLLLLPAVVALIIAVAGGLVAHSIVWSDPGSKARYVDTTVIATFATVVSAVIVVVGFWANYDRNFGGWFGSGDGPDELNIIPFALVCGAVPPIAGALAGWLNDNFSRAKPNSGRPARTIPQASTAMKVKLAAGVAVCSAVVSTIGAANTAFQIGDVDTGVLFQLGLGFLINAGIVAAAGGLLVRLTTDHRELWLFAVILISSSVVGIISVGMYERLDPILWQARWQITIGLATVAVGGVVAAYTARRQFHAGGKAMLSVGFVSVIGILLVAGPWGPLTLLLNSTPVIYIAIDIVGRSLSQVALSSLGALLSVVVAAVAAHLTALICRR